MAGLEILGAIGLAGKELWSYNRELFKYDENQRLERDLTALELKVKQFELYREDVRDLVELTVGRMDIYHLVGAMLLEFTVVFYCEGRIHTLAPPWILLLFFGCLSSAFCFLIMAVWLSMHASVCSHSFGVRLLTRFVRLPIPSSSTLNQARTKYAQFEKSGFKNMFRIPFVSKEQVWQGDAKTAGAADILGNQDEGAVSEAGAMMTTLQDVGEATMPLGHIELYRRLQARWQVYDAYARVCMSLGVNQIMHSVCIFICAHMLVEQYAPFGVFFTVIPLELCNLLVLNLDVREAERWEFIVALFCTFGPVLFALLALTIHREYKPTNLEPGNTVAVVVSEVFAAFSFLLIALWYIVVKRFAKPEELNGSFLPYRFRAVLYLDVFGDVKPRKQLRAKSRAWEEEKVDLLQRLEEACNNLNTSPLEAMQDLQSAAVSGVTFLDTYAKDEEVEHAVTKAAVFFEEHKFRIDEEEIRQQLSRWQSAKVSPYLKDEDKKELDELATSVKETVDKIWKLTTRRAKPCTGTDEFSFNHISGEISVRDQSGGRTFHDFKNGVKNFQQMGKDLEETIKKFKEESKDSTGSSSTGAWGPGTSGPTLRDRTETTESRSLTSPRDPPKGKPKPIIEMHDMATKAPDFAPVTDVLESDKSFYPNVKEKANGPWHEDYLSKSVTFMGRSLGSKSVGPSPAGADFDGTMGDPDDSRPNPETLPWVSVRAILNVLLLAWMISGVLAIANAIIPGYMWGWGDVKREPELEFESVHDSWPTPHFEINKLHCLDEVYVDNPYGARWKVGDLEETTMAEAERRAPGTTPKVVATFGNDTVGAMAGDRVLVFLDEGTAQDSITDTQPNERPTYALPISGDDVEFVGTYKLAVLRDNMLSLWDVLSGERVGEWKVEDGAKAFCHTADHIYIGADSGLHRAQKPASWGTTIPSIPKSASATIPSAYRSPMRKSMSTATASSSSQDEDDTKLKHTVVTQ